MLDLTKPVRMKSGKTVKILTTGLMGSYPILGICANKYCLWREDGLCLLSGTAPENDLENVPRKESEIATGGNQISFDQVVENRIKQIRSILCKKAKEYASKTDRFHNFRVAARKMNTTPEIALQGMMAKHEVAVLDMINDPSKATEEMIDEKIGDNINYLILLEGLLKERINHG